jgi:outer membrane protein assembly factor BamB
MLFFFIAAGAQQTDSSFYPEIATDFPLLWKARTGNASFRSNVIIHPQYLIIGSNGDNFRDFSYFDKESGVVIVDRFTGRSVNRIADQQLGDMDVNGILLYEGRLYFGNDNEEFLCTTLGGNIVWRNPTSGDIEHQPERINIHGRQAIVYASEMGEVRAVDPLNGKTIWQYYTPDFDGWKRGDNRLFFKVKAFFSNSAKFFTKPQLADLNYDGVFDLVYLSNDNKIYAINGANGKKLWIREIDSRTGYALQVAQTPQGPMIGVPISTYIGYNASSENYIQWYDRMGIEFKCFPLPDDCTRSLNHLPYTEAKSIFLSDDGLYILSPDGVKAAVDRSDKIYVKTYWSENKYVSRHAGESILANASFNYGDQGKCVIVLNQHYYVDYQRSYIEIVSLDNRKPVKRLTLPATSEMPPLIDDVNKDGFLDLVVNCFDNYTYCYNLKIPFRNLFPVANKN